MKTFAIGNGKYYGNGLCIAPEAVLTDGVLDIFACGNTSALDFILNTIPLKTGKKVKHREVSYYKAEKADQKCVIEADGEILGYLPATIEVLPKRISFLMKNPGQQ
jgi:diacylglycerol kinase (ATP)